MESDLSYNEFPSNKRCEGFLRPVLQPETFLELNWGGIIQVEDGGTAQKLI